MESLIAFFEHFSGQSHFISYFLVFAVLLISGFGVPIPEDITLVSAGILASQGLADPCTMFLVCMAGVLIGDSTMYFLGYIYGIKILRFRFLKKIVTAKRIKQIRYRFQKNGTAFLFIARFLPGLRAAIYLFSGVSRKVSYLKFILIDFTAAIISVPVWVVLGYLFGDNLEYLKELVGRIGIGVSIAAVVALVAIFLFIRHQIKKKQAETD